MLSVIAKESARREAVVVREIAPRRNLLCTRTNGRVHPEQDLPPELPVCEKKRPTVFSAPRKQF